MEHASNSFVENVLPPEAIHLFKEADFVYHPKDLLTSNFRAISSIKPTNHKDCKLFVCHASLSTWPSTLHLNTHTNTHIPITILICTNIYCNSVTKLVIENLLYSLQWLCPNFPSCYYTPEPAEVKRFKWPGGEVAITKSFVLLHCALVWHNARVRRTAKPNINNNN